MPLTLRDDFDMPRVIRALDRIGGASFAVLPEETRESLLAEALRYQYHRRERIVGPARVQQDVSGMDEFPPESLFLVMRDAWQSLLQQKIADLADGGSLFNPPLRFNELSLQRYEVGSQGITPHLDAKSSLNLICVFTLTGHCRFCLCEDRAGHNAVELDATPGTAILLRAPGFRNSDVRRFHFVTDIQGPRISFGLRQRAET